MALSLRERIAAIRGPQTQAPQQSTPVVQGPQTDAPEADRIAPKKDDGLLGGIIKGTLRAPQRFVTSVALEGAAGALGLATGKEIEPKFTPRTKTEKFLFGEEPVVGAFSRSKQAGDVAQPLLEKAGLSPKFSERLSQFGLGPAFVGLAGALDVSPVGGGGKQAGKKALKELTERYGKELAETIAKKGGKKGVERALSKTGDEFVEQVFRADKLNLPASQTLEIEARLAAAGLAKRKVRTFKDMQEAALELGTDATRLLKETATNRITDKEVVALRELINNNSQFIANTTREIAQTTDEAAKKVLDQKVFQAEQQLNEALKKLVKGGTEAGRTVAAFRIIARQTLDPTFWLQKARRVSGKDLTPEVIEAINDLTSKKDIDGLATFVSMLRKTDFTEKAVTLWKAGLLTSPTTHAVNVLGNLSMRSMLNAADVVAVPLDLLASFVTGKRTTTTGLSNLKAQAKGLVEGIKKGKKFAQDGIYDSALLNKYDLKQVNYGDTRVGKILNGYTQTIFRSLGSADIVFRQIAISDSLEKSAKVIAKNEGLSGGAFLTRVKELLMNPTVNMQSAAIDAAEEATFQGKNKLTDIIAGAKASAGPAGRAAIEVLAPFTKTPTNIAKTVVNFSPAGFIKAIFRAVKPTTRNQKELVRNLSQATTGTGIMALGAYLMSKGKMTGNAPTSASERDQFFAEGKQANAILLDGKWVPLNRLSPFGNLLTLGANFEKISGEEPEATDRFVKTGFAGIKALTEQTFLKGVAGGLKALTDPERSAENFIQQTVASTVPTILTRFGKTLDPTLKQKDSIMDALIDRLPVLRERLPEKIDIFGEPVRSPGGRAALIDPFGVSPAVDSKVINEAKEVGVNIGTHSKTINKQELTPKEYKVYQTVYGSVLKQVLTALVDNPAYQSKSTLEKKKLFEKRIRETKSEVKDILFPAIMIERYDLPVDTNPKLLMEVLTELGKNDRYKKASEAKKADLIRSILGEAI